MSNLKFKFWRDSLQTSVQICHESVAISVKVNRESDFCQPFICISFFFFELVHPVLWLRLMVFTVVEFSAKIYKNESIFNQEFISWMVYVSWFLTIFKILINQETDFCRPFIIICISFFFFKLVHPVLWLRLMVVKVVEFSS